MKRVGWVLAALIGVAPAGVAHADDLYQCQSPSGNSAESGITCTDSSSGHFFRLSRQSYELH